MPGRLAWRPGLRCERAAGRPWPALPPAARRSWPARPSSSPQSSWLRRPSSWQLPRATGSQLAPALAADAHLASLLVDRHADPRRLPARRADDRHRRDVQGHELVDDAALVRAGRRLGVPLRHVHTLEDHLALGRHRPDHLAAVALVLARPHDHPVALSYAHHNTSGASDTILMNFLPPSSRPPDRKMGVPRGCCWSLIST